MRTSPITIRRTVPALLALTGVALSAVLVLSGPASATGTSTNPTKAAAAAKLATANQGRTACGTNSLGGHGFYTSCGQEWCADFVHWAWGRSDLDGSGLTPAAASFYDYGKNHPDGSLHTITTYVPKIGDAVVYSYDKSSDYAKHVAIVTKINSDGSIVTENGNDGDDAMTDTVGAITIPKAKARVGQYPANVGDGYRISAFVTPWDN